VSNPVALARQRYQAVPPRKSSVRRWVHVALLLTTAVIVASCSQEKNNAIPNFGGDARRGATLVNQYGCGQCHDIPQITNANGNVGPPLHRIGTRAYIAGVLNNSPDNLALWIENPQAVVPGNAMPNMGISHEDSRDITAFLYTLK
jgi:cytochrome c